MNADAYAGNYTWNGSTSTNWSTTSNWSPAGVPSTNDTVTLSNGGVNSILLDGNRTITRLIISANTIDLNTYELHVSGRSSLNGGAINNGNLKIRGTYVYFQGTNFNCILDVIAGQIKFSGGTFDKTGSFEQNGSASGYGEGGCTFNDDVTIKNTGSVYLRMGQDAGDTFNGKVYLYSSGNYSLQMAYGDTSYFNDTIYVNSTGNGGINFANGTYGASILSESACLITGSIGISAGTIQFKNMVQSAPSSNSITASGTVLFNVYSNSFLGKVNFTAPNLVVKSTIFGDSTSLTKTGHTLNNTWDGANVYNGVVTITNGNTSTAYVKLASQNADTYNKDVYFNAGTGAIQAANAGTNIYNGNVSVNGNNVTFNTSGGTLKFAGEQNQEFGGGTSTLTFNKLIVDKAGGSVTLNQPITIDSLLQLTSGIIYTDTLITLKATANTTGASNMSYVDGAVKKIGNTAFVFPVGDEGFYGAIEISAPSTSTDAFAARFFLTNQEKSENIDTTIRLLNTCSYWELTKISGTSNVYVSLYWDSIGCGLFDTLGLVVASWDGTSWKSLSNTSITGNVLTGKVKSGNVSTSYSSFTWANRPDPSLPNYIPITPTLVVNSDPEWNHAISEDYFGYNGSSVLDPGQYWSDLGSNPANSDLPVLLHNGISNIRINGGTNGNYWDWRTGWFIPENELPYNLFYTRASHKKEFPSAKVDGFFVNDMAHIKTSIDAVGGRPIFQLNNLTSTGFNYEVASLYRANELNLPVKYVELGNEFYLSDEEYLEVFPSSFDYISKANAFTQQLKSLSPFNSVKVAVVGASATDNSSSRRSNWLNIILAKISTSGNRPDAITIHEYYSSGLAGTVLLASNIGKMFIKPFDKCKDLFEDEIQLIKDKNSISSLNPPLEVWLTEYNMNDDLAKNIGTWAHGLFNAIQALKFLESPIITHTCSHAMTSDAVFGNIFESDRGFSGLTQNQLPFNVGTTNSANFATTKFGFTASGAANNEIALAMKGNNVIAHKIDFSSNASDIGYISYVGSLGEYITSTDYLNLYGWSFEKEEGFESIILNLGNKNYSISSSDISSLTSYNSNMTTPLSMVQLTCFNPTAGISQIYGPSSTGSKGIHHLKTTGEIDIPGDLILPPYSLTRIIYRNPNTITIRLTDDTICAGTTTSILVQGANHNAAITLDLSTSINYTSSDSLFIIPSLAAGTYNITATAGSVTSNPVTLTVHPAMSVTASILSNNNIPCVNEDIILTATVNTTNPYSDVFQDYTYLWVPDNQISDHNPFQQSITIANADLKSDAYQVFVYDGYCWASSNVFEIDRGPVSIDLGEDFTVCYTNDFNLRTITTTSPLLTSGTLHYKWLVDNVEIPNETLPDIAVATNLAVGTHTYRVEVWSDNGIIENENCPQWDEIVVNIVNCCTCSSGISLTPTPHGAADKPVNNYISESDIIDQAISFSSDFNVSPLSGDDETVTITGLTSKHFCTNGELWIRNADLGNTNLKTLVLKKCTLELGPDALIRVRGRVKLILEGCVLKSCDGSTNMWDGIYVDVTNEAVVEPELEITKFVTTPTKIMNAKNGVVARRESPFIIEDCVFENNYKDILLEKYIKTGTAQDATIIKGCTFSASGTLLAPYGGDKKFTAIELNEIEGRTIGDITSANAISKSMYGIFSRNASFTLLNTEFNDLEEDVLFPESGTGIYATSDYDYTNRKITLGNGNSNGSNTFKNSINGLIGVGEMNYYIYENIFGKINPSEPIAEFCIKIENSGGKEILIEDGNEFFDYTHGIDISSPRGKLFIHGNTFHDALFPTNPINFEGTAINVYSSVPTNLYNSEISLNTIGSTSTDQTRIGIHLSLISKVNIKTNSILFKLDASPTDPHLGIWLENCSEVKISDVNNIQNFTNFQQSNFVTGPTGLRLNDSPMSCIENNTFTQLGIGMHVTGQSIINSLYENIFNDFNEGIFLDNNPYIGPSVGTANLSNPGDGNVMGNTWTCSTCVSTTNRITGSIMSGLDWYYTGNTTNNSEYPDNSIIGNLLNPSPLNGSVSNDSECLLSSLSLEEEDTGLPLSLRLRNETFGGIVTDSTRYPDGYYDEFRYNARQMAFSILKKNPDLIVMDDDSDTSFVSFYNETLESNINKIDSLETLLSKRQFVEADTLLNHFTDTNNIEHNYKRVYKLYIKQQVYGDTSLSSTNRDELNAIAYEHPLTGGLAVFVARNILKLEVHDGELSSARMMQPRKEANNEKLIIYPNPANQFIRLKYTGVEGIYKVRILDIAGREIFTVLNSDFIDTSILSTGLYYVRANVKGNWFNGTFVISR